MDEATYIGDAIAAIEVELPGLGDELTRLYALLALVRGVNTDLRDVHDAWAVWRDRTQPGHRSIVPFDQLAPEVQELDRKYRDGIRRVAATIWTC